MMPKGSARVIPYDPVKAIGLYRRAATVFSDAGCSALQAAFCYIFHWSPTAGLGPHCADLTHGSCKERFMFSLPYIGLYAHSRFQCDERIYALVFNP